LSVDYDFNENLNKENVYDRFFPRKMSASSVEKYQLSDRFERAK
jgi:hypothetical protein